jgi:uncharacterized membrane protein YfcA
MLLPIHMAAGDLAIVLGAAALLARKGGTIHRRSGLLFVCAMLVLGISAAILGFRKGGPTDSNVFGGLMTVYFVVTALTTVRPVSRWTRYSARVAKLLPEPFPTAPMRALPIVLVFGAMFYWLWKVRRRGTLALLVRNDSMPLANRTT